jgi:hypothetical protein
MRRIAISAATAALLLIPLAATPALAGPPGIPTVVEARSELGATRGVRIFGRFDLSDCSDGGAQDPDTCQELQVTAWIESSSPTGFNRCSQVVPRRCCPGHRRTAR